MISNALRAPGKEILFPVHKFLTEQKLGIKSVQSDFQFKILKKTVYILHEKLYQSCNISAFLLKKFKPC